MGSNFDLTAEHNIEISVTGSSHVIKVDGMNVMEFTDNTFTQGSIGVRSWNDSEVIISDTSVAKNESGF